MVLALLLALALPAPASAAGRPAPGDTVTVVTLNLWHDQRDWPRRLERIVAELRALHPDVVCLQEVLQHATLPNQARVLADRLGYAWHFTSVDSATRVRRYGNAILTPHPVLARGGRDLLPLDDYRTVAHVRLDLRGRPLDVYDTHLHHTSEGAAIRAQQIGDLLAFIDRTRGGGALVLAGDFNTGTESAEMGPLAGRFVDAFAVARPLVRGAEAATLNPALGHAPHRIDHVFVGRDARPALMPATAAILFRDPGPDSVWASDHFGLVARLTFAPRGARPPAPSAGHPAHWWAPVPAEGVPEWEILPQSAGPGEVIVSKRHELGSLSNFAATPFVFHGRRYASLEGLWQSMHFPEGPDDPRARLPGVTWTHTRAQVEGMTAFEAKDAGGRAERDLRAAGIDWVSFEGERFPYRPARPGRHHALIVEATREKVRQNPEVARVLLATGDLVLRPDHRQEPDAPEAWRYCDILMGIRERLRTQGE